MVPEVILRYLTSAAHRGMSRHFLNVCTASDPWLRVVALLF